MTDFSVIYVVYVVSCIKTHGLESLKPQVSRHGKAYVYATQCCNRFVVRAKHDDFDFIISVNEDGIPEIYNYRNVQEIYEGVSCSVYEIDGTALKE